MVRHRLLTACSAALLLVVLAPSAADADSFAQEGTAVRCEGLTRQITPTRNAFDDEPLPVFDVAADGLSFTLDDRVIDLRTGAETRRWFPAGARGVTYAPDGSMVAFSMPASFDAQHVVRDLQTGETFDLAPDIETHSPVRGFRFSDDGSRVAFVSTASAIPGGEHRGFASDVYLWDRATEETVNISNGNVVEYHGSFDISADGTKIVYSYRRGTFPVSDLDDMYDERVYLHDTVTGVTQQLLGVGRDHAGDPAVFDADADFVLSVAISDDGSQSAWNYFDRLGTERVALRVGDVVHDIEFAEARELRFVAGSTTLLVRGQDQLRFIDADASGVRTRVVPFPDVPFPAFSDDGRVVIYEEQTWPLSALFLWQPTSGGTMAEATSIDELIRASDWCDDGAPVLRLYQAFFDRPPDLEGAKYWLSLFASGDVGLDAIAASFAQSQEFQNTYAGMTDEAFVTSVYEQVLGRPIDQDGFDYWLWRLQRGTLSRAGVVRWISASREFIAVHPFVDHSSP